MPRRSAPATGGGGRGRFASAQQVDALLLQKDALSLELLDPRVPREADDNAELDPRARSRSREPLALLCAGHPSLFTDALRPDHDLLQLELNAGNGAEQLHVEPGRAGMPFPPRALLADDFVDAVRRQCRHEPGDIAAVLGDRVRLPELADLAIQLRRDLARQQLTDVRRHPCHGLINWISRPRWSTIRCTTKSTSCVISLGR